MQNVQIQIELDALIQPSGIIEILCWQNGAEADLIFFHNGVAVLRKRGVAPTVNAEIQNQHSFAVERAVSFFPAACVDLVERNADTGCQCIEVQ